MNQDKLQRDCRVCGKELNITVYQDHSYEGGHYFGRVKIPIGEGENVKVDTLKLGENEYDVVEWTGEHEEFEYWECDDCYND